MSHTFTPEVQPYLGAVRAIDLPFDFKNTVTTWKKQYGITEVPLHVRSAEGQIYDDKKFKGVFKDDMYKCIVGRKYVVYPNEELNTVLHNWVDKPGSGLRIVKQYFSHHGDASYWQILSDKFAEVKADDKVQIGCIVRNSVGTYVALGADLFTYRLICSNGAIAKGKDLGSIAIRHIGNRQSMVEEFSRGIEQILERTRGLIHYYKQSTKMKLDQRIAEAWAQRIPQRALPEQIEINSKTGQVTLTGAPNLWDSFNDITANSWKNQNQGKPMKTESGFLTKNYITQHAHKVLIAAVDGTLGQSRSSKKKGVEAA